MVLNRIQFFLVIHFSNAKPSTQAQIPYIPSQVFLLNLPIQYSRVTSTTYQYHLVLYLPLVGFKFGINFLFSFPHRMPTDSLEDQERHNMSWMRFYYVVRKKETIKRADGMML